MDKLWAPWRMRYVGGPRQDRCVFCAALGCADDREAFILHRGVHAFIILNLYPYNSGHAMIVPYQHVADLRSLSADARGSLLELAELLIEAADAVLHQDGLNLGLNIGEVAGAGVADHLHMHVVPRWSGDANFMPIVAGTTVMPEVLPVTYARLRAEIERVLVERTGTVATQAGAVVVLPEERVVVLRRAATGEILIPKGHIEHGESAADAAIREVFEETGVEATILGWAGTHEFTVATSTSRPPRRHVSFFFASGTPSAEFEAHLERDTVLVPIDSVLDALSVPAQRDVVAAVIDDLKRLAGGDE